MADALPPVHVIGLWKDPQAFLAACASARDAGFVGASAYAPFPVHGLETAMGHKPSWIGNAVLAAICLGAFACWNFFYASSVEGWPIIVTGMPFHSPAFWAVEILETALLAGVVVNLVACFHACKLVPGDMSIADPRATDDAFCLVLPVCGERYTAESLTRWMDNRGAERIEARGAAVAAPAGPATGETAHA